VLELSLEKISANSQETLKDLENEGALTPYPNYTTSFLKMEEEI
jgi:hypothetical protein